MTKDDKPTAGSLMKARKRSMKGHNAMNQYHQKSTWSKCPVTG